MNVLVDYIKNHVNWRAELSAAPYHISIRDDGPYTLFSYNQIESDFSQPIVQVCRGIILKITEEYSSSSLTSYDPFVAFRTGCDVKIVCWPFNKFFNYSEPNAHSIDWSSAKVQEKVDGSIIKVWYDKDWHVSTNGVIDAFKTDLQLPTNEFKSFGELFMYAAKNTCGDVDKMFSRMCPFFTYVFELVSPFNRVVVPYKDAQIYFIGLRRTDTGEEFNPREHIPLCENMNFPRIFSFTSFENMIESTKTLPYSQEGYVVVDKNYNRVKVKSLAYLQVHHLKDNGNVNLKRVLELVKLNEIDEYLSYFPEYTDIFYRVKSKYDKTMEMISGIKTEVISLYNQYVSDRKGFALYVLTKPEKIRKYYFVAYDGNENKFKTMIDSINYDDLI